MSKLLSHAEYEALRPTYDPGPLQATRDADLLRRFLDVEGHKRALAPLITRPGMRFLDIGCGAGGALWAAQELGCEVLGIEPSQEHSTLAREVLGLHVQTDYFDSARFQGPPFDVVLLSHVIEHAYDPARMLEGVMAAVAPGGVCRIVTPNARWPVARAVGPFWPMLDPVDHVSLMSRRAFEAMGIGRFGSVTYRTSEYLWEPAAVVAAALVRAAARLRAHSSTPQSSPATSVRPNRGGRLKWMPVGALLRPVLTVLSLPLHGACSLLDERACLVVEVRKARD